MRSRDPEQFIRFCEKFCVHLKGSYAGKPVVLLDWQKELVTALFEAQPLEAYIQMPRKNGKSILAACLALYNLVLDGEEGADIYSVSNSKDQARLVFDFARDMAKYGPLASFINVEEHKLTYKGSVYKPLAAKTDNLEGLNPHFVIYDELHASGSDDRLYEVMKMGMGFRDFPLMLSITTPGAMYDNLGRPSVAWKLYQRAKRQDAGEEYDPEFWYKIYEPPAGSAIDDEEAWKKANPALGNFLHIKSLRNQQRTSPEQEFKIKRLGLWTEVQDAWLPHGAWDDCPVEDPPEPGTRIVLGFDGSKNKDATALIGSTVEPNPKVFVVDVWEKPDNSKSSWKVSRKQVTERVAEACKTWEVEEIVADPNWWLSELEEWEEEGLPVVEFPQSPSRMVPATNRFYQAVIDKNMRHDGSPVLARHLANAAIKPLNGMIYKDRNSQRAIDAGVAAVMAYDRASELAYNGDDSPVFFVG